MTIRIEAAPLDIIKACATLAESARVETWDLQWGCPHVPNVQDGHNCDDIIWRGQSRYRGSTITASAPTAHDAALALIVRIMAGAECRCGRDVTLSEHSGRTKCRWNLEGDMWVPGCDADAATIAKRGDYNGMMAAVTGGNRAERRSAARAAKRVRRG